MRPPRPIIFAVVLTVASLGGVVLADAAGPDSPHESVVSDSVVPIEDNGTYWRGQVLTLPTEAADSYELRTADDRLFVDTFEPSNGSAVLNTTPLDSGTYVLVQNSSAAAAYRFDVVEQRLSATESADGVTLQSNRASYSLVVESSDLSDDQLHSLFPAATDRNGTAVVRNVGPGETIATNASAVPDGKYEIRLRALDTDANDTVSLSVSSNAEATTARSTTETTSGGTATTAATSSSETTTATTSQPMTDVPGFGVPIAILVVAFGLGIAAVGRER